jgi:hypothetical protein
VKTQGSQTQQKRKKKKKKKKKKSFDETTLFQHIPATKLNRAP